jgi:pentatricopeptide repeat protein
VPPTEATFAAMVDACVSNGAVDDALDVFRSMKAQIPDFATPSGIYLALIRVLAQRKETAKAMEVYADMRASRVQPSLATFNALIDVCARQGDVDRASQLFRDMCSLGVSPDLITYSTVIKGYCVQGDLEQAIQLFTLMRKRGIHPDAILFNSILDGAARKQMTSLVEQVLGDMEGCGIAPSNFTLSILVKLYGRSQDLDTALRHVETMSAKYGFVANDQVYTCLVAACANCGRMAQAYEVFRKLASPDAKAFTTVINGALKHNDVSGALQFLERGVAARCGLGQDVVDNVIFMAQRRKLSSQLQALAPKLATAGYTTRSRAVDEPEAGVQSRVQERRGKAQSWRDIVARE